MTYALIDRRSHKYYTYMRAVFDGIGNAQTRYNWLITDCVCYPENEKIEKLLEQEYCWLSGEELTDITQKEDFQWIWAVLCGFEKDIPLEKVLEYPLPSAQEYDGYYRNPVSVQHPLASVEIVPSDSSWMLMVSNEKGLVETYRQKFPKAEDLSSFNNK